MSRITTEIRLGAAENAFAQIVWDHEPISSGDLVKLCKKELNWARSTTYTVLKRLCDKGLFRVEEGVVSAVLTREGFIAAQTEAFMNDTFESSLPAFIAAFTAGKKLKVQEAEEIRRLIDACVEDGSENIGGKR
ncbi:MAG: BlaI/MecI/CopY family transcriptional regulator [Lachnospiraceae bacterium]|nr:BlaI/MecI/CopY family transcriptional regulator [Lachnospiraceae bacterium]